MKLSALTLALLTAAVPAFAQPSQAIGDNSTGSLQNIGDVDASKASSNASQINPSANQNGNDLGNNVDTRTQVSPTINPNISSSATGAILGNESRAQNGDQTLGQVVNGNSRIGDLSTGASTATAAGGSSTGTNLGINGQQQGIDRSGNADVRSTTNGTVNGRQALTDSGNSTATGGTSTAAGGAGGTSTQGQSSRSTQATSAGNGAGAQAGANAGAGAGANNRTANTTRVDASDRSTSSYTDNSKLFILPTIVHGPALAPFMPSNSNGVMTACMPRKIVWREPVVVLVRNSFWPDHVEQVGWDESLRDDPKGGYVLKELPVAFDEKGGVVTRLVPHGTQALIKKELTNAASGTSFGLGGLGNNGGAQVGGMSQGAIQRWTTSIELFDCPLTMQAAPAQPPIIYRDRIVYQETPAKRIRE